MVEPLLAVVGVDHHRTPVQLREKMAVAPAALAELNAALRQLPGCQEAVTISTCNRVECYLGGTPDRAQVVGLLAERQGVDADLLDSHSYWLRGGDCVRHLFRVAASLESLVIGEYQIVHQIKNAYEAALAGKHTGALLNPLFQRALAVAKDVRNQTAIGKHKLSVASVAVDLAKQIYGELSGARLLVIGAGEIAELAVKYLVGAGVRSISIINRSQERALALAEGHQAAVWEWEQLREALGKHDIVVSSTSANHLVVMADDVRQAMRHRRAPLMLIDLAVPRDIDDQVAKLDDVYLYNIDHLDAVVVGNRQARGEEVDAAAALVDALVQSHLAGPSQEQGALLAQIAGFFQDIIAAEEVRLGNKLGILDRKELRYGLERVGNKLQHQLLRFVREHPGDPVLEKIIREMLGLG